MLTPNEIGHFAARLAFGGELTRPEILSLVDGAMDALGRLDALGATTERVLARQRLQDNPLVTPGEAKDAEIATLQDQLAKLQTILEDEKTWEEAYRDALRLHDTTADLLKAAEARATQLEKERDTARQAVRDLMEPQRREGLSPEGDPGEDKEAQARPTVAEQNRGLEAAAYENSVRRLRGALERALPYVPEPQARDLRATLQAEPHFD